MNTRIARAEERISELEEKSEEVGQAVVQRDKEMGNMRLRETEYIVRSSNLCLIGVPEEDAMGNGREQH